MVRYLQLAHNEWDPAAKTSRMKVLYNSERRQLRHDTDAQIWPVCPPGVG